MSSRAKFRRSAVVVLCALGAGTGWYFHSIDRGRKSLVLSGEEVVARNLELFPVNETAVDAGLKISETGEERPLILALDEIYLVGNDGESRIQKLEPAATRGTLAARLKEFAGFEALPIAYPEGEERNETNRRIVTNQLRVQIPVGDANPIANANGLQVTERPDYAPGWVVMKAADSLAALDAVTGVRRMAAVTSADVLLGRKRFAKALPNDPMVGSQWHLKKTSGSSSATDINVENTWKYNLTGGVRGVGVRIGIIDDGIETAHPDLAANVDTENDYDWVGGDSDPNHSDILDFYGETEDAHGTSCAGVAAARGNNGVGVSGVAPEATLVGLRLLSDDMTDQEEAQSFAWKNDLIQVKSNSWGPNDYDKRLEAPGALALAALANATTNGRGGKGTIFTWAGGNGKEYSDYSNFDGYANSIYTIAVGATNSNGSSSSYSESGTNILICAPSSSSSALGITTTDRSGNSGYNYSGLSSEPADRAYTNSFGGTSSATPVISGVVALMLEKNPALGWRDVQEILVRSASKFSPSDVGWKTNAAGFHFNDKFGAGLVNATAAVDLAATWKNLKTFTSLTSTQSTSSAIPENSSIGTSRTFNFSPGTLRVEQVTVQLQATHSSRGNLQITLTSPSGMISELAPTRADTAANYNWTFSSVQHWGETAAGNWTVRVADVSGNGNTSGGTLGAVTLTLYGASTIPVNPPPEVAIASPATGSSFSPSAPVAVTVNASDITISDTPGVVSQVELLVDNVVVATDSSAPYEFSVSPSLGIHSLTARATDSEGLSAVSSAVSITIANQAPSISGVTLSSIGQGYADQPLMVSAVAAVDPESDSLTYSYRWQSSADGVTFANAGSTTATLAAAAGNAGKMWRCLVTASDGARTSNTFTSAAVNLLTRPVMVVKTGAAYQYTSGLVLRGVTQTVSRRAIINEFSQGVSFGGDAEWIEILVLQSGSLSGWRVTDANGGYFSFNSNALWANVPAGTLIVVFNGYARDSVLPSGEDLDVSDGKLVVNGYNSTYFSPAAWLALSNAGSSISLRNGTTPVHSLSYGSNTTYSLNVGAVGASRSANFTGDTEPGADLAANWISTAANSGVTPGSGNSAANLDFISKLRTNTLSSPAVFRLKSGSTLPTGLSLNSSTGVISGTVGAAVIPGTYNVVIERYNSLNEIVSQNFTLRVYPANFAQWIGGFGVSSAAATADSDSDGLPNLIEYLLDTQPNATAAVRPISFATDGNTISLTFRQSTVPTDATLITEWSQSLDADAVWLTRGITTTVLEQDDRSKVIKAEISITPSEPRRFFRLRAVTNP